ncbi:aminotransferase class V-fold PLP-dependent enzyme [Acidobacteriota bacterium]
MSEINRRKFIQSTMAVLTGSVVLHTDLKSEVFRKAINFTESLSQHENSEAYWELVKTQFPFEDDIYYFNNASLGPSPEMVRDAAEKFRRTLDSFPSKYMWGGWAEEKETVREKAARLMGVSPEEIAINHNTTEGMNVIAASLELEPGDEVIIANHEHSSGHIPWKYWKETKGIKLVRPTLPILPETPDEIVEVYKKTITPKTKVISMCHIINTNGMILPVKQVTEYAHSKGILVAVDGAQSAGMFPFSLRDFGCDFYAASSHKWLFSPKGVGIFYAKKDSQKYINPLIVANGYEDPSIRRFENYNTRNLPEYLGLGSALDFISLIGPEKIGKRVYELKKYFRERVDERPYLKIKTPHPNNLSAGITVVEVMGKNVNDVRNQLLEQYKIDCRPMNTHDLNALRISLSIFITQSDIDYLIQSIEKIYNS